MNACIKKKKIFNKNYNNKFCQKTTTKNDTADKIIDDKYLSVFSDILNATAESLLPSQPSNSNNLLPSQPSNSNSLLPSQSSNSNNLLPSQPSYSNNLLPSQPSTSNNLLPSQQINSAKVNNLLSTNNFEQIDNSTFVTKTRGRYSKKRVEETIDFDYINLKHLGISEYDLHEISIL